MSSHQPENVLDQKEFATL